MTIDETSALQALATERLGEPIRPWIEARREAGESYYRIALLLIDATSVSVTGETIRKWCNSWDLADALDAARARKAKP